MFILTHFYKKCNSRQFALQGICPHTKTHMVSERKALWIVAVSGGVDSMVLLDLLQRHADRRLIVAHVDHGIRSDSRHDAEFVRDVAKQRHLRFETTRLNLAGKTDEATARRARYEWLESMRQKYHATAIVTAHHQDDVLETVILNLRRGTGWRGLASLRSGGTLLRPLLTVSKAEIVAYAIRHKLEWREDGTNYDPRYARNAVRHAVIPRLNAEQRAAFVRLYLQQCRVRDELEAELAQVRASALDQDGLARYHLIMLDHAAALELLQHHIGERLERPHAERLLVFARSARPGAQYPLPGGRVARVTTDTLIV